MVPQRLIGGLAIREWGEPDDPAVLMWPGLGATSAYFASLAADLDCRTVSVDPPGFGASPPGAPITYARMLESARLVVEECGCVAVVGHSLGGFIAASLAAEPATGVRCAVLIDGGYLTATDLTAIGMPVSAGREQLIEFMRIASTMRFPDWNAAYDGMAAMIMSPRTAALEAYVHALFTVLDGEVCQLASPEHSADLVIATLDNDVSAPAIAVPTLLIACGRPARGREIRQPAWEAFAASSPAVELRVVEEWAHNPGLEDPDGLSALIAGWSPFRDAALRQLRL